MNDHEITDKLLDEIAVRIRNAPVPDYPGPPQLNLLASDVRTPAQESSTSRPSPRTGIVAVSGCLVALLVVAVGVMTRHDSGGDPHPIDHIVREVEDGIPVQIADLIERRDLKVGPVRVASIDTMAEFNRMTDQLDRLAARLHMLETEVALREVQSDAATLLAEYAPRKSTVW